MKASAEEDADVGDRANDRVRVDGTRGAGARDRRGRQPRLHAARPPRVLGQRGGRLNTDAIDNSGGVDMSDHEVNIKILLDLLVKKGVVESRADAQPHPAWR